ncbi:hypothetical protein AURDEDRAFT_160510 [Auricularia subglabra TFB-10046 SS5]|nr:hypothetical protein AURDEDRAFT_160510 [Auricularia subglabra TFB-10046 SS5]
MRILVATVACAVFARASASKSAPQSYVGVGTQGLVFTPAVLSTPLNHEVHFVISNTAASPNITVVQSMSFEEPCTSLPGGLRSISRGADQPELNVFVSDPYPIYLHAEPYCHEGMVFILNPAHDSDLETFSARARASALLGVAMNQPEPDTAAEGGDALPLSTVSMSSRSFSTAPAVSPMAYPQSMVIAAPATASSDQSGFIQEDPSFPLATTCSNPSHSISAATLGAAIVAAVAGTLSIVFLIILLVRVRASRQTIDPHTQMVEPRPGATPSPVAGSSHTANGAIVSQFLDMSDDTGSTLGRTRGRSWVRHLRKSAAAPPPSPV